MEETSFTSHKDNRMHERNGYCNQNAKMGIKVLSLFFLRPLESSHIPGCHFTILWIFRMGKSHEYWEKTTAHSQELLSSLLEFTHKLQVHTRNLKITLLLEFKGSKLKISQASLQWYWKCRFFFSYTNRSLGNWDVKAMKSRNPSALWYPGEKQSLLFYKSQMLSKSRIITRT